jgi:virginiamycin B lyase
MSNHIAGLIRVKALLVAAIIFIGVLSAAAVARGATITEFSSGIPPFSGVHGIAAGPDGNLWFTEESFNRIGRITPQGVVTQFGGFFQHPGLPPAGLPPGSFPYEIAAGPDGRMWFTNRGTTATTQSIGRITTAGSVSAFIGGISASSGLGGIALGPDGNLWFTEQVGRIGRITPQGAVTEFSKGLTAGAVPVEIATGPDGNLWFTEESSQASRIGRITPQGVITEFSNGITPGSDPSTITAGPDGNMWFTEVAGQIGRITPMGVVTEFPDGGHSAGGITAGPDGNLWFTLALDNQIGRITPSGAITKLNVPTPDSLPSDITAGPDGNLWFTEGLGNQIGVVCIVLACRTRIIVPHGLAIGRLSTTLDQAARVGILVEQVLGTKRLRIGRVPFGFHRTGRLRISWNLRVNGRKLPQGRYLITLRALDNHDRVIAQALPATLLIH